MEEIGTIYDVSKAAGIKAAEKTPRTVEGLCHLTEPLNYFCSLSYIVPRFRLLLTLDGSKIFQNIFHFLVYKPPLSVLISRG